MASKVLLDSQAKRLESLLSVASNSVSLLKDPVALKARLVAERQRLMSEVEKLKEELLHAEIRNGRKQIFSSFVTASNASESTPSAVESTKKPAPTTAQKEDKQQAPKKEGKKEEKKEKKEKVKKEPKPVAPEVVDVSRLDMRVGLITKCEKHPEADKLYLEDVDIGVEKHRTVLSGLVDHVPLDQMQNRLCVFLLNLKPAKMKGIMSEAMVMCANKDGKVEILKPPPGVKPGDRVIVPGYEGTPDAEINPKKKLLEQILPDLKTDSQGRATYKGVPWTINGPSGVCTCNLTEAGIK